MNSQQQLSDAIATATVNADFTEAVLKLSDGSRLCFCHRVGQRWAKAVGPAGDEEQPGMAGELLEQINMFRLNAKHLDIQFNDGSRWEERLVPRT